MVTGALILKGIIGLKLAVEQLLPERH